MIGNLFLVDGFIWFDSHFVTAPAVNSYVNGIFFAYRFSYFLFLKNRRIRLFSYSQILPNLNFISSNFRKS